jgi:acyl-CoA thioesterase I
VSARPAALAAAIVFSALLAGCAPPASPDATAVASMTAAGAASPRPTPAEARETPGRGTYLALGDSLAVGVGASSPSELGYVGRIAAAFPDVTLRNLAVSGETSASLISGGQLDLALDAIRTADPPVSLVTLDIGGNDLLRLLWTEPCASAPGTDGCRQLVLMTVMQFEQNYQRILVDVSDALGRHAPDARVVVLTYFNPFSGTDASHESAADLALLGTDGVVDCARAGITERGMNDVIACVAADFGFSVVDVHPLFEGLGLELTHIGSDDIHANDRGYEVIAGAFFDVLTAAR